MTAPAANSIIFASQILEIMDFVSVNCFIPEVTVYTMRGHSLGAPQSFRIGATLYSEEVVARSCEDTCGDIPFGPGLVFGVGSRDE